MDFFDYETRKKINYLLINFPEYNILRYLDGNEEYMKQSQTGLESWARENFQRNAISLGILNAKIDDIILISDVDEIINADAITYLRNNPKIFQQYEMLSLKQIPFFYSITNPFVQQKTVRTESWFHPKATTGRIAKLNKPNVLRTAHHIGAVLDGAGWHFSYFGGESRVKLKHLSTCLHENEPDNLNERSDKTVEAMRDILSISDSDIQKIRNDYFLPDLIFSEQFKDFFIIK